nr:glucose uptake inhibitor SgrT [uncultured Enterobacter sp.]
MTGSTARQFYLRYFIATQGVSWLARQSARQRVKMLEELMQWEVTIPIPKN